MKWILLAAVIILLIGPLRRWVGRHWAFLLSVVCGAAFGFFWASYVLSKMGCPDTGIALLSALIVSIAAGRVGPALLRQIERDGRDGHTS